MKYTKILMIVLVLFSGCKTSYKVSDASSSLSYSEEFIDDLFKDFDGDRPGASVIVIKEDKIEFSKSYGYADLENKILATPHSNYRIASVTKQFTALAIMMLIEEGKLSYETNLTEVFPEYPEYGKEITIRQLLTHRSGLVKYNRFIEKDRTAQMLDVDVLNGLLKTDSTYFKPNTRYAYSNTGYAVLAQIIERIEGIPFGDFMDKRIFQPLEMTHSVVFEKDKIIKNRAYGYVLKDTSITAKDQSMTSAIQGDGGIYTSVMDYFKWDKALYSNLLISQTKLDSAFYNYDEDGLSSAKGYGYGWYVNYYNGKKIVSHGGSSMGFGSHVIRVPSEKMTVAIFTNRNRRGQELPNKAKALLSHFSKGKFLMPFEVVIQREIDQFGLDRGIELYHDIKTDTVNYKITKEALFNYGIANVNANKNSIAKEVFSILENEYSNYFGGFYGKAIVLNKEEEKQKAIDYFYQTISKCSEKQKWAKDHSEKMIKELKEEQK